MATEMSSQRWTSFANNARNIKRRFLQGKYENLVITALELDNSKEEHRKTEAGAALIDLIEQLQQWAVVGGGIYWSEASPPP